VADDPRWLQLAGWSGVGKTTLIVHLLRHAAEAGDRAAVVKWSHHRLDAEDSGSHPKDTERFVAAGADWVYRVAPDGVEVWDRRRGFRRAPGAAADPPWDGWARLAVQWVFVEGGRALGTPKVVVGPVAAGAVAPPVVLRIESDPPPGAEAAAMLWARRLDLSVPVADAARRATES
jgi:molybdopterin-guanine dinucleotide biosynthesis protein MobB